MSTDPHCIRCGKEVVRGDEFRWVEMPPDRFTGWIGESGRICNECEAKEHGRRRLESTFAAMPVVSELALKWFLLVAMWLFALVVIGAAIFVIASFLRS